MIILLSSEMYDGYQIIKRYKSEVLHASNTFSMSEMQLPVNILRHETFLSRQRSLRRLFRPDVWST